MLCPTFDIDPSKPWNGRNLSTPSTGLGHLFLPFPELKLSGPAAELICAELAKGRDVQSELGPEGHRSVARDVGKLLCLQAVCPFFGLFPRHGASGIGAPHPLGGCRQHGARYGSVTIRHSPR